jgi:hypothetical protein
VSYVDDLIDAYGRFIALPWQPDLAHPQRVLMAIYPPEYERRLRLRLADFKNATTKAQHGWRGFEITHEFEHWLGEHEYREAYFSKPQRLEPAMDGFFDRLVDRVSTALRSAGNNDVVAMIGAGSLYGLGEKIRVSALLNRVDADIKGRLLVFFPGQREENRYRLLGAGDGWNYLATPIVPGG